MNNSFLINFTAQVNLNGMLQLNAENKEEAIKLAKKMIHRNLNLESCMIELGTENNNDDIITIREMEMDSPFEITDIMPLK